MSGHLRPKTSPIRSSVDNANRTSTSTCVPCAASRTRQRFIHERQQPQPARCTGRGAGSTPRTPAFVICAASSFVKRALSIPGSSETTTPAGKSIHERTHSLQRRPAANDRSEIRNTTASRSQRRTAGDAQHRRQCLVPVTPESARTSDSPRASRTIQISPVSLPSTAPSSRGR
jgi:hypothetical protein